MERIFRVQEPMLSNNLKMKLFDLQLYVVLFVDAR
jgi:hypothetical protein